MRAEEHMVSDFAPAVELSKEVREKLISDLAKRTARTRSSFILPIVAAVGCSCLGIASLVVGLYFNGRDLWSSYTIAGGVLWLVFGGPARLYAIGLLPDISFSR